MLRIERDMRGFMDKHFRHETAAKVILPLVRVNQAASPEFVAGVDGNPPVRHRGQQNCRQAPQGWRRFSSGYWLPSLYRLHAAASGIPRLKSTSRLSGPA